MPPPDSELGQWFAAHVQPHEAMLRAWLILADAELAALPIVASIRSDNIAGFVRFLSATPGVRVEQRSETEIVFRRKK